jgi:hypothetical protein
MPQAYKSSKNKDKSEPVWGESYIASGDPGTSTFVQKLEEQVAGYSANMSRRKPEIV